MQVLNNGRIGLGTGSVGAAKKLLDLAIDHVKERRQFGRPLAEFELVQDKIGWMVSYLFGLESMCYLTCGLVDRGVEDYSLESAICKVSGTEFLWYAANRAMQLRGGEGYMKTEPYEKILRDIRIFPIFEGANDVLRAFIALSAIKPRRREALGPRRDRPRRPDPLDRRAGRLRRRRGSSARSRRTGSRWPTPSSQEHADAVSDQVEELRGADRGAAARAQAAGSSSASSSRSGSPTRSPTSTPRWRCSRESRRSSRTRGSSPPGRSATSPTPSAPAPAARVGSNLEPGRVQRRRADDGDREARLQARRVRLRAVRGLSRAPPPLGRGSPLGPRARTRSIPRRTRFQIVPGDRTPAAAVPGDQRRRVSRGRVDQSIRGVLDEALALEQGRIQRHLRGDRSASIPGRPSAWRTQRARSRSSVTRPASTSMPTSQQEMAATPIESAASIALERRRPARGIIGPPEPGVSVENDHRRSGALMR